MLTPTTVLNYIEKRLGFQFTDIELSHDEILENIRKDSLVVFSKYFPHQERLHINDKRDKVPGYINRYFLHCENEIINVNRVIGLGTYGSDGLSQMIHPVAYQQLMTDPIQQQISADVLSLSKNPVTFIYYSPDQIEVAPNYATNESYIVICNVVHDKTFATIPINLQDEFCQLCYADTCMVLYSLRKRFQNMQTSFGSMELNVDDLSEGTNLRQELIEKFTTSALKYSKRKKLIIA